MEFILDKKHKFAEIWMTNADQADPEVEAQAQRLCKEWHAKGYLPVIYRSGKEDLYEMTSALLISNRNRMARREAEAEHAAQQGERQSVLALLDQPVPRKSSRPRKSRQQDISR